MTTNDNQREPVGAAPPWTLAPGHRAARGRRDVVLVPCPCATNGKLGVATRNAWRQWQLAPTNSTHRSGRPCRAPGAAATLAWLASARGLGTDAGRARCTYLNFNLLLGQRAARRTPRRLVPFFLSGRAPPARCAANPFMLQMGRPGSALGAVIDPTRPDPNVRAPLAWLQVYGR